MEATHADVVEGAHKRQSQTTTKLYKPIHANKTLYLKMLLTQKYDSSIWGKLYKRRLFTQHSISFVEGINFAEDLSVVPRAIFNAKRTWIDECVYIYRIDNNNSYTHQVKPEHLVSFAKANEVLRRYFTEKDVSKHYQRALEIGLLKTYWFTLINNKSLQEHVLPYLDFTPTFKASQIVYKLFLDCRSFNKAKKIFKLYRRLYLWYLFTLRCIDNIFSKR